MPIDASIPLQIQPPQQTSPLALLGQVTQLRALQEDQKDRALKRQVLQQGLDEQKAVKEAIAAAGGDLQKALPVIARVSPTTAKAYQDFITSQSESLDKHRKAQLDAQETSLKLAGQIARGIKSNPAGFELGKHAIGQLLGPEMAAHLGEAYDPAVIDQAIQWGTTQEQAIQQARDAEAARHNVATETNTAENNRVLAEGRKVDDSRADITLAETLRHNRAAEAISRMTAGRAEAAQAETARHNRAMEEAARNTKTNRPITSGDAGRMADFDTSLDDLSTLRSTLTETKNATGTSAAIGASVPAFVTDLTGWGTDAKKRQGVIDRVKQVIGKTLEGGVLRKEDEYKYAKILPNIKDTPEVAASKLNGLEQAVGQRRSTFLSALEDAGYDTSRFPAKRETGGGAKQKKVGAFTVTVED